jgi:hypothetical protein
MSEPVTHTSLSEVVDNYDKDRAAYKIVEGEFRVNKDEIDKLVEKAKEDILSLLPDARDMLEALMRGAESEAIRWNVTKFVIEFAFKGGQPEDELARLITSFKKK